MKTVLSKTQTRVKQQFPRTEIYLEILPRKSLLYWQQTHAFCGWTQEEKYTKHLNLPISVGTKVSSHSVTKRTSTTISGIYLD